MSEAALKWHLRRALCRIGIHGPFVYNHSATLENDRRWCRTCWARWRATYDGIEAGWSRLP